MMKRSKLDPRATKTKTTNRFLPKLSDRELARAQGAYVYVNRPVIYEQILEIHNELLTF